MAKKPSGWASEHGEMIGKQVNQESPEQETQGSSRSRGRNLRHSGDDVRGVKAHNRVTLKCIRGKSTTKNTLVESLYLQIAMVGGEKSPKRQ